MKGLSNSQSIEEPEQQASECEKPAEQPEEFLDKKTSSSKHFTYWQKQQFTYYSKYDKIKKNFYKGLD